MSASKKTKGVASTGGAASNRQPEIKSAVGRVAALGISDLDDVTAIGCAIIEDLALDPNFDPQRANAMTKAANLVMKTVEVRIRASKVLPRSGDDQGLRLMENTDRKRALNA